MSIYYIVIHGSVSTLKNCWIRWLHVNIDDYLKTILFKISYISGGKVHSYK